MHREVTVRPNHSGTLVAGEQQRQARTADAFLTPEEEVQGLSPEHANVPGAVGAGAGYGVVVDSVNVSVLLSARTEGVVRPIVCLK